MRVTPTVPVAELGGRVGVTLHGPFGTDQIEVSLGWTTGGYGDVTSERAAPVRVTVDPDGGEHAATVELSVPLDAPPTYAGQNLTVDWSVDARAAGTRGDGVSSPIVVAPVNASGIWPR